MAQLQFTSAALEVLKKAEGYRSTAYWDTAAGIWTVGYGHTGPEVGKLSRYTMEEAEEVLKRDILHAENAVRDIVECEIVPDNVKEPMWDHINISNNFFSGLVIFAYNIGANAFENSSLADYLINLDVDSTVNKEQVYNQMRRWNKSRGVVIQGLVNRREIEIKLMETPDVTS